jgi:hypothetical protein
VHQAYFHSTSSSVISSPVWSPRLAIIAGTANVPPNDSRPDRRRSFDDRREAAALAAHANSASAALFWAGSDRLLGPIC